MSCQNESNYSDQSQKPQTPIGIQSKNWLKAPESTCDQVKIGFGFASHWLRKWRKLFQPITERSKAKPKQTRITCDTQYKESR